MRELAAAVTVDNTGGLRHVAGTSYNRVRSINLRFMRFPGTEGYLVQAWGSAFPEDGGGGYQGRLLRPHRDLEASIEVLRRTWQDVVETRYQDEQTGRVRHPFADAWDLSGSDGKHRLIDAGVKLAMAGHNTFKMLFHGGDKGLDIIRDRLLVALRRGENVISVESDSLIVPWGMLYTGVGGQAYPAAGTWSFTGFWGYQHVIEHTFTRMDDFDSRITIGDGEVVVGLNVDHQVDEQYPDTPFVTPLIEFFTPRAKVVLRRNKDEVAHAFQDPAFPDHITCFACHGKVAGGEGIHQHPYLQLSNYEKIYGADIMAWLASAPLATRPFVFLGACQGGQVSSLLYSTFGQALLCNGARCLIGPQVDLPPAFAYEYTRRLFTLFLEPGAKLGDIVRTLARTFIDDHANPLGLMFSLYRGIDVHLWRE